MKKIGGKQLNIKIGRRKKNVLRPVLLLSRQLFFIISYFKTERRRKIKHEIKTAYYYLYIL